MKSWVVVENMVQALLDTVELVEEALLLLVHFRLQDMEVSWEEEELVETLVDLVYST
jgi:hypothetical protein